MATTTRVHPTTCGDIVIVKDHTPVDTFITPRLLRELKEKCHLPYYKLAKWLGVDVHTLHAYKIKKHFIPPTIEAQMVTSWNRSAGGAIIKLDHLPYYETYSSAFESIIPDDVNPRQVRCTKFEKEIHDDVKDLSRFVFRLDCVIPEYAELDSLRVIAKTKGTLYEIPYHQWTVRECGRTTEVLVFLRQWFTWMHEYKLRFTVKDRCSKEPVDVFIYLPNKEV